MHVLLADVALSQSLQAWAGPVQAIATVLLLPILLLYVRKAWQTAGASGRLAASAAEAAEATKSAALQSRAALQELQSARAAETAPYIIAYLDVTEEHLVYAVAKNIGRTPARDVSISFDPSLSAPDGGGCWDLPAFLSGAIPFFPPQYELRSILGVSLDLFTPDSQAPMEYHASIQYLDPTNQTLHADNYTLDLSVFRNARSGRATTLADIHSILQQVGQEQRSLSDGMDAVRELLSDAASRDSNDPRGDAVSANSVVSFSAVDSADGEAAVPEPANLCLSDAAEPLAESSDASRLRELCAAWRNLTERRRWESAGLLQQRLRDLPPDGAATNEALAGVLGHRFYLDGGESLRAFDGAVDRLLATLEAV